MASSSELSIYSTSAQNMLCSTKMIRDYVMSLDILKKSRDTL